MSPPDAHSPAPAGRGAVVLQVFIFRQGEFIGTDVFVEKRVTVGRDPDVAQLVLASSSVSRLHAVLEHDGAVVTIRDAESTNGLIVNQKRVASAALGRLDEVQVGEFSLKVKLVGRDPPRFADLPPTRLAPSPLGAAAPAAQLGERPTRVDDSAPASLEPERPTRVDEPPAVVADAGADWEAPTRIDASAPPVVPPTPARSQPAMDDWDDVSSELSRPRAVAEFREAPAPLGKDEFGAVLAGLGIAQPSARSPDRPGARSASPGAATLDEERETFAVRAEARDVVPATIDEQRGALVEPEHAAQPGDQTAAAREELDDEDDDDEHYEPPYSLVAQLLQEDAAVASAQAGEVAVEVLTFLGDSVTEARLLRPGESFWTGPEVGLFQRRRDLPPRTRLVRYRKRGECRVELRKEVQGTLKRDGERVKLDAATIGKHSRRGSALLRLRAGEVLDLADGTARHHIRFVAPPPPTPPGPVLERLRPSGLALKSLGSSVSAHLVGLITIGLLVPKDFTPTTLQANDAFVEVKLEVAPELAPPPEEKPKEEPKQAESEKVPPGMEAKPSRKRPKAGGTSAAPAGVLGLLSKRGSSAAPGPAAAVAAVSNLTAARVPGASSGYRVSGLIGKLPTSSLSVGGGGGGLMTKGGAALLRGGGGGGGLVRGSGTRGVGGLVQKNPGAMRSVGQGTLDRDEIQKVINQNIGQIQRCYERELLKKPGLSGKVQVEWTIATSGKVRSARQSYTSLQSTDVTNCILSAIRTWAFPQPRGGEVIVNYPFIFKSIGF